MDLGLEGKVALVTGGSKGIGEAITRTLLAEGAGCQCQSLVSRRKALEAEYAERGQRCMFIQGDLIK